MRTQSAPDFPDGVLPRGPQPEVVGEKPQRAAVSPEVSNQAAQSGYEWKSTDYMHARYYSPNLGRFVSVDPIGGSVGSSQSWNRYSYALNNPLLLIDPDGRAERVVVRRMWKPLFVRVEPTIRSEQWTDSMVGAQMDKAYETFRNQAGVYLQVGAPNRSSGPDSLTLHEASRMVDSAAIDANRSESKATPILFVGEIEGSPKGTQTTPGRFGPLGAAIVGDPSSSDPLAAAHELGHGMGNLDDSYIGSEVGSKTMSATIPNLMNDTKMTEDLEDWQVERLRETIKAGQE